MVSNKIQWLKEYFSQGGSLPEDVEDLNYFEIGVIDSFGVVELIEAIESTFSVQFHQNHFTDRRFSTIRGLAGIIEELEK